MRVRAIAPGFFDINKNGHPVDIKVGQVFEVPDGHKPSKWFVPADPPKADGKGEPPAGEPKKTPNK